MATQKTVLNNEQTVTADERFAPTTVAVKKFAVAGAIKTLPVGTLLAYNTSTLGYVEWATGGANGTGIPRGLVYPDPIEVTTAGEVLGNVMMRGKVHRDAIVSDGGTPTQIDAALTAGGGGPTFRELGIDVLALAGVV